LCSRTTCPSSSRDAISDRRGPVSELARSSGDTLINVATASPASAGRVNGSKCRHRCFTSCLDVREVPLLTCGGPTGSAAKPCGQRVLRNTPLTHARTRRPTDQLTQGCSQF
jgi:hypothetical protein